MGQFPDTKIWRFINSGVADGSFNMAADDALARHCQSAQPILRIFAWNPAIISIGFHQNISEINFEKCGNDGIDVVRRPTGGGAVLHDNEITYSLVIPVNCSLYKHSTLQIYNQISLALVESFGQLNIPIELGQNEDVGEPVNYNRNFACFATSAKYEIQFNGRKIVGSAQRKFKKALLHHGSIILGNEHLRISDYLFSNNNGALELQKNTASLEEIAERRLSYDEIAKGLKRGFRKFFHVQFKDDDFSKTEQRLIEKLKDKYINLGEIHEQTQTTCIADGYHLYYDAARG